VRAVENPGDTGEPPANVKYVITGIILVIIALAFMGMVLSTQRKRAHGVTWFPEGFRAPAAVMSRRRRDPHGQEMRNLNKQVAMQSQGVGQPGAHWSDDESDMPLPKRQRSDPVSVVGLGNNGGYASDHTMVSEYEEADQRVWSQAHLDVADVRAIMTPPAHQDGGKHDVDARGPCGLTPLMIAAVRGGGLDTGEDIENNEDSTAQVISDLLAQGAELNATMDKTGETSLHLAARFARADAAKRLLDAGADANCQDNTGRTPIS